MELQFPKKLRFLFDPHQYKCAYGGRDGAKSWGFATALLELGAKRKLRILCARETMQSLADSVHKLLSDTIQRLNLSNFYTINQSTIRGKNGTEIIFAGLRHNIDSIKSLESADIVWVEEAQTVSKNSWDKLIPTIRKEGAEIWVSFNPDLATDDTYKRWVLDPPKAAKVVKIGWEDNRWLSSISRARIEEMREKKPEDFSHIYGGECRSTVDGAIFANELKIALAEGRIAKVPYDRTKPVETAWDLGFGDPTCIWFLQPYDGFYNFIDYIETTDQTTADYVIALQNKKYMYGTDWLPHDGIDTIIHQKLAGTGDRSRSIEMLLRQAGRKVRITPKMYVADQINAARLILPQCRFDTEKCADGLQALRHYQWGPIDEETLVRKQKPLHNWASHGSSAFMTACFSVKAPKLEEKKAPALPQAPMAYAPYG